MPSGSRAAQRRAVETGIGAGLGDEWLKYTDGFADQWDLLRRDYLEHPYSPGHASRQTQRLLQTRNTVHRAVSKAFKDERLRALATWQFVLDGHDPRNVPSWMAMMDYVEQSFGVWTVRAAWVLWRLRSEGGWPSVRSTSAWVRRSPTSSFETGDRSACPPTRERSRQMSWSVR